MKRRNEIVVIALIGTVLVACSSKEDVAGTANDIVTVRDITITSEPIATNLSNNVDDTEPTRSIATGSGTSFEVGFQLGDSVGIFPQDGAQIPFALPIPEGTTVTSSTILAQGWATQTGITYSVYYPYNRYNVELNNDRAVPWDYRVIQHQTTHNTRDHLGKYWFIGANNVAPTINEDGTASFAAYTHVMGAILRVQCILPVGGDFRREMFVVDDTLFATHGTFDLFDETGGAPTNYQDPTSLPLPCTYQPFHALGHTDHITLDIGSTSRRQGQALTTYFAIPETDLRGHTATLYLWDADNNLYVGTATVDSNTGYLSRHSMQNIAFMSMHATTTLDVKLNDWEKEELCPTCTPVAW